MLVVFAVLPAPELDDELELLDDPQPAVNTNAEQAIRTGRPLLIERSFLGESWGPTGERAQEASLTHGPDHLNRH